MKFKNWNKFADDVMQNIYGDIILRPKDYNKLLKLYSKYTQKKPVSLICRLGKMNILKINDGYYGLYERMTARARKKNIEISL